LKCCQKCKPLAGRILIEYYQFFINFVALFALHNKPSVMKTFNFFALVGLLFIFIFFQPTTAARLEQTTLDVIPNYVVIGAFSRETNAARFTNHAQKDLKLNAKFEMNLRRNLYYVYVLSTEDLNLAVQEARRLREESEFRDTWVYRGSFSDVNALAGPAGVDINPVVELKVSETQPDVAEPSVEATQPAITEKTDVDSISAVQSPVMPPSEVEAAAVAVPDDGKEGTKFLFKISRETDLKRIRGDVEVIDVERNRKMGTYKGNLTIKVSSPQSKSGKMSLICDVFGYRKAQRDINYNDPESGADIIRDANGSVVVPFELSRLKKGDIAVMYNVYFFKDASVMRPESRYEVNSLMEMLNENPKYRIKIHGHTNGNAAGKIISMDKDSQNFFSLNDTKEGLGSAKQLSEARATIIRDYLASNGIDPKRMEIKAWGGKHPIHDKLSNRAQENVRVEIEILQD
jgi:outer membrane protein OmpA-like peptidoglycan-associated protein